MGKAKPSLRPELVAELRAMRANGSRSAALLRFLDARGLSTVEMMDHFRVAFALDAHRVSPIGGWFADGSGELDDDAISRLLDAAIAEAHQPGER